MSKFESTNVTLIANKETGMATLGQNGKIPAFIEEQHLEELRDLCQLYLDVKYNKILG